MRTARLVAASLRRSWGRALLLALLTALSIVVLCVVSELSRQSTAGLDSAIEAETGGATGTYTLTLASTLGSTPADLARRVAAATASVRVHPLVVVAELPALRLDCPPGRPEQEEALPLVVVYDADLRPADLPYGKDLAGSRCLAGTQVDPAGLYQPTPAQQHAWGAGLALHPDLADTAALSSAGPIRWSFVMTTGRSEELGDQLATVVDHELGPEAQRNGESLDHVLSTRRVDSGDGIRAASEGIALVYRLIGWATVLLAALGLLVSQSILVGQRMWFFGLMRAIGAPRRQIAALVLLDVAVVLAAGFTLATAALAALQPLAASMASTLFGVEADLLRWSGLPALAGSAVLILAVAGIHPARKATRGDPVDVLEPATG